MALITLASAKGAPGVTTTSLLLGALWPRPVLVAECDPSGADVASRMPGADGGVLDAQTGLLSLAAAGRRSLRHDLVRAHTQQVVGGLDVLLGPPYPEQAGGLQTAWAQLGPLLSRLPGTDVVADLGRIGAVTPQNALLNSADAVVLLVDTAPSSVLHLRHRLGPVSDAVGGAYGAPVHVAVVSAPKRTQPVREIRDALESTGYPLAGVHHLAYDERGADVFQGQVQSRPDKLPLVRSATPFVTELAAALEPAWEPDEDLRRSELSSDGQTADEAVDPQAWTEAQR